MIAVLSPVLSLARRFVDWWLGELAGLVPARIRRGFAFGQTGSLVLVLGPSHAALCYEQSGQTRQVVTVDRRSSEARQALADALDRAGVNRLSRRKASIRLQLTADLALRNTITLPLDAESNLREVITFELERHTPFRSQDVHFAYRVLSKDPLAQR